MRLAAALIYLSSVAHVAAIGHGFPSTKSTSNFIDVNPLLLLLRGEDAELTKIKGRDPPRHRRARASPL